MKQFVLPSIVVLYTIVPFILVNSISTLLLAILVSVCINLVLTGLIKIIIPTLYKTLEDDVTGDLTRDAIGETLRKTHLIRAKSEKTFSEFQREVTEIKKEIRGKQ